MIQDLLPPLIWALELAVVVLTLVSIGRTFRLAGAPGWAVVVPVYNAVVLARVAQRRPTWQWALALHLPLINLIAVGALSIDVARRFDRGKAFGFGLAYLPFVFYPLLAFVLERDRSAPGEDAE